MTTQFESENNEPVPACGRTAEHDAHRYFYGWPRESGHCGGTKPLDCGVHVSAPRWVHAVLPEEIVRQRALGWPDFHPEDFCHRCGRRNPVWSADQDDWETATEGRPRGVVDILCPSCFVELCEANGGEKKSHLWILRQVDFTEPGSPEGGDTRG